MPPAGRDLPLPGPTPLGSPPCFVPDILLWRLAPMHVCINEKRMPMLFSIIVMVEESKPFILLHHLPTVFLAPLFQGSGHITRPSFLSPVAHRQ